MLTFNDSRLASIQKAIVEIASEEGSFSFVIVGEPRIRVNCEVESEKKCLDKGLNVSSNNNDFTGWAIVEIMGHQKYAGHVSTQAIGGASMVRVDVPEIEGHAAFTKMFGAASIYCLTPVDELVAKSMAKSLRKAPVDVYEFPKEVVEAMKTARLPAPKQNELDFDDDDFHDDSDEPY